MIQTRKYIESYVNASGKAQVVHIEIVPLSNFSLLEKYIENYMSEIVRGAIFSNELEIAKKEIIDLMSKKTDLQNIGLVGEFFMHVVLRYIGFTQQSVFNNLEESSLKKGFDGLYSIGNELWISESKSGFSQGLLHKSKITEALNDLKEKLTGRSNNNPFRNALYHLIAVRKRSKKKFIDEITELSKRFTIRDYPELNEYNVIPVSTLFVNHSQNDQNIINDVLSLIKETNYSGVIVICIDNLIYSDFVTFLRK